MNLFSNEVKNIIQNVVKSTYNIEIEKESITISRPPKEEMGNVSTSISFVLAKKLKKSPLDIAEKLLAPLKTHKDIKDASYTQGFINFFFKDSFFFKILLSINQDVNAFSFPSKNIHINLEFVSANPTGPLHIGHGRWAALGDSIARLLTRAGYTVQREFYVNDAGVQIQKLEESVQALRENKPIPEGGYQGEYLKDALDSSLAPDQFFLQQQKELLEAIGVHMDYFYSEKSLSENNEVNKTIAMLKDKNFTYEKDGALWFASSKLGDDKDRPIIKSDGTYTYFAPDIAYHYTKIKRGADWIIDILGADHHGYIKRISAAVEALSDKKVKFNVILGQLVNLYKNGVPVRMSKRKGNVITLQEVVDEIGVNAIRYMLVSKRYNQTIDFDLELVKKTTKDNPLFYIQYAYARINSILQKIDLKTKSALTLEFIELENPERNLVQKILDYKQDLLDAIESTEPQKITTYLFELASLFHKFYEKLRVIENDKIIWHRVEIIEACKRIIKDGLSLLGITIQEKM
jgi:arginyl-tRNA synthetase